MDSSNTRADLFHDFIQKSELILEQIRAGEDSRCHHGQFEQDEFWNKLGVVFKKAAHEATKLSLVFSQEPAPNEEECRGVLESVEKAMIVLVSVYYSLPLTQGATLRKALQKATLNIIEGIKSLAETVGQGTLGSQQQLQTTGAVWHETDIVPTLPKSNREAVLVMVKESAALVTDALSEVQEIQTSGEDGEEDDGFEESPVLSDAEKALLAPCSGLIKTSKFILKKTCEGIISNEQCEQAEYVWALDHLAEIVDRLSPAVDDFASCLYPPLKHDSIRQEGERLYQTNEVLLTFLKQSEIKIEKLDPLLAANKHNWDKLSSSLGGV
ncbi:hypothetical protein ScPMuIL_000571 [Solemya velum]